MDDPPQKGTGAAPAPAGQPPGEADEFAAIPRPRTRHPLLAAGAGVLALFLVVKMRADLAYFMSSREAADLGDARALVASERGRAVLAEGINRLVRVQGTPDRESALQVDTKGSWTFTQFFKLLGTDGHLFVHRREDPLPAFRAERDVFEGRLLRFSDLSFEDSIRAHFAGHVSSTHFFAEATIVRALAAGIDRPLSVVDLTGDRVMLGPNDILAISVRHPDEIEVGLPIARFSEEDAARAALLAKGARIIRRGPAAVGRQVLVVAVRPDERDRVLNAIGEIDQRVKIHDVREPIKARLSDIAVKDGKLTLQGATDASQGATDASTRSMPRLLNDIDSIRTLGTVQIPEDAFLIVEAETPRSHSGDVAVALVLLVFASVNLVGLAKGLRR